MFKSCSVIRFMVIVLFCISIAAFLNATPPGVEPIDHYYYLTSYGTPGHKDGQFMTPKGMAFSPDGRMLAVSDTHNNRVCLFYVDQRLTASEPLLLRAIYGDLWPWDNRTDFADSADKYRERDYLEGRNKNYLPGRAYRNGQAKIRPGEMVPIDHFNLPVGVSWLGTDTILIADTGNHRIKALALNGEVRWILGREGWKDGYFHEPLGIAVGCDRRVYVTEPRSKYIRGLGLDFLQRQRVQGNRLQIFSQQLKPEKRLGHMHRMSGRDYRQFKDLTRVWVSRANEVYLADNGNHRVMVFDEKMQKLHELNKWPLYRLRYPNGIDGSLDGRLAIADTGNHRVVILNAEKKMQQIIGKFGTSPGHLSRPMEARFGPNGDLYVLNAGNCRIDIFRTPKPFKQFPRCPLPEPPERPEKIEDLLPPPSAEPMGQDSL